jgi:hypothetical protein
MNEQGWLRRLAGKLSGVWPFCLLSQRPCPNVQPEAEFRPGPPGRLVQESYTDLEDGVVLHKRAFLYPDGRMIEETTRIPPAPGAAVVKTHWYDEDEFDRDEGDWWKEGSGQ